MDIKKKLISNVMNIIRDDKKNIFYLIYYSAMEAILLLSIPLAASFIINSILAHANISIMVLGTIVVVTFILITILQVVKEHIIEKFQQKVFVKAGIDIASRAIENRNTSENAKDLIHKNMNYFFDILSIQKIFPVVLLDGTGLIVKIVFSLLLLLAFNTTLFFLGLFFVFIFVSLVFLLGRNGIEYTLERSTTKHNAIYYLQHILEIHEDKEKIAEFFDNYLQKYITARNKIFRVVMRQLTLTFVIEGLVITSFLVIGGYLVINSTLPLGEFVAAEILVVSITNSLKGFMKQIDYIYDMIEGLVKVDKLSDSLQGKKYA